MLQIVSKGVEWKYFEQTFVYDQYSSESEEKDLLISVPQINFYSRVELEGWQVHYSLTGFVRFVYQGNVADLFSLYFCHTFRKYSYILIY